MSQSPLLRACMTALTVGILLGLLRRAGPRTGGLAAALPMTSVPALAWACADQGPNFAAAAAAAALLTTATTGVFAMLYAHAAARLAPVRALVVATLPAALLAVLATAAGSGLAVAVIGSLGVLLGCRWSMPMAPVASGSAIAARGSSVLMTATVAGVCSALIGSIAPSVPALLCGAVAAIPVIGMTTTVSVHVRGGPTMAVRFLHGYLHGLWAKVAFLALLAGLLPHWPPAVAWAAAAASGVAVVLSPDLRRLAARVPPLLGHRQWI